jgi:hypothetical protein
VRFLAKDRALYQSADALAEGVSTCDADLGASGDAHGISEWLRGMFQGVK